MTPYHSVRHLKWRTFTNLLAESMRYLGNRSGEFVCPRLNFHRLVRETSDLESRFEPRLISVLGTYQLSFGSERVAYVYFSR